METLTLFSKQPVAYFSAEYALLDDSRLYAGGLGVLAGDYVIEAGEQNMPLIAVGLFYHQEHEQNKHANATLKTPSELGLSPLLKKDGAPFVIVLRLEERDVHVRAWIYDKASTVLLLLDTDIPENYPDDRAICNVLYAENRDIRLKQEAILGMGGMRFLDEMKVHPSVYHLNEGHSALLSLELIRHEIRHHSLDFEHAVSYAKQHIVFTNHTLVAAGKELFTVESVRRILGPYIATTSIPLDDFIKLGLEEDGGMFSLTMLALTMSFKINAVSALHAIKAREMWGNFSIESITNGVSLSRWDAGGPLKHKENKKKLIDYIKEKTGQEFEEDTLLIGWGRRLVSYKQPLALFKDIERLKKLKVRIVYAGPLNDEQAQSNEFVKEIERLAESELKGMLVFLPHYNVTLSKLLVSGTDIWLNTPEVGREACGTSGMKGCLNGSLPLSTNDGWVYECDLSDIGWVVDESDINTQLLDAIEHNIIPMYEAHMKSEEGSEWGERMQRAQHLIKEKFSATRQLKEYVEKLYIPTYHNRGHNQ